MTKPSIVSVIDDDEAVRDATGDLIRSLGYEAATFGSAAEFLRSGRVSDTACLIVDVQMPGMSGVELQQRLILDGHRIPVIFMTAFPLSSSNRRSKRKGSASNFQAAANRVASAKTE